MLYSCRVIVCGFLLIGSVSRSQTLTVTTRAGFAGQQNANGTGTNALFNVPAGAAVDGAGNVYVADFANNTIHKITPSGVATTLAGSPGNPGSANGSGANAFFNGPQGVAVDAGGNVYVADSGNNMIRKITPAGAVTTLAGNAGTAGSTDGTGTNALFYQPAGVAVDISTNVYVADYGNHTIRKITAGAVVSTLAGSAGNFGSTNGIGANAQFYQPEGVAVDSLGNVYVADTANHMIRKITAGVVSTLAGNTNSGSANGSGTNALFNAPQAVSVDTTGNIYVADTGNNMIRAITPLGVVTTLAGSTNFGSADGAGTSAQFWGPAAIAVDSATNIYVADYFNGTIRKLAPGGAVTTLAGSASNGAGNAQGVHARFSLAESVAADGSGNIYVADTSNDLIRKITPAGTATTLAGSAGHVGSADGVGTNALFYGPQAVASDGAGNVYVADTGNNTIRKITAGTVTTLAGLAGISGVDDGIGTNALFYSPQGIAVDSSNNVYVADTLNFTIRKISAGTVTTLAGTSGTYGSADGANALFNWPKGLAVDGAGNVYVADYLNHTIRQITPGGVVSTLAGLAGVWGGADGTNGNARFFEPEAIALDQSGNLFVADSGNHAIRKITAVGTNWVVTTVAGSAGVSGSADGTGNGALFYYPAGITIDGTGNIYVADSGNNTVRLGNTPVIFGINNVAATPQFNTAFITWNTTLGSSSQVLYGTNASYGSLTSLDPTPRTSHSVELTGLASGVNYYFKIVSISGTNQAVATGNFLTGGPLIVQSPQATYAGVWTIGTSAPDKFSSSYKFASTTNSSDTARATFQPTIITPGYYDVYIWYSEGSNRSTNVPVVTSFQGDSVSTNINQSVPGGSWQLLTAGKYFAAGAGGFVRIGNGTGETGKVVIADAVQWVYSNGQDTSTNGTLPAWWVSFYFGTNTVNGSSPGANGYSLFANYVLGTSPIDPTSTLNFNISPLKPGIQATFSPWQAGNTYALQSAASLALPVTWTTIPNLTATQNANGDGVIVYTNSSGARAFYRLSVQAAP